MYPLSLGADLDSCPKAVQSEGDEEEREWGGGGLYAVCDRLADGALVWR